MAAFSSPEEFTPEQLEAREQAERVIITARKEAAAILERAAVALPDDELDGRCMGRFDGSMPCSCTHYTGDGEACRTRVSIDPAVLPPHRGCGHPKALHTRVM